MLVVTLVLSMANIVERKIVPKYELVPMHIFTGKTFQLRALNNQGKVIGELTTSDGALRGFVYHAKALKMIPSLPACKRMFALSINNYGHVVGYGVFRRSPGEAVAYLYNGKGVLPLNTNPSSSTYAHGITDTGLIVGYQATTSARGVTWRSGRAEELTAPEGSTFAYAANNRGEVVGSFKHSAVLWKNTKMSILEGVPPAGAAAINDAGTIVGRTSEDQAFLRRVDGSVSTLPTLLKYVSARAYAVNEREEVVGQCTLPEEKRSVAVLWARGQVLDLNKLLSKSTSWRLEKAWDINDHGVILGSGSYRGKKVAFLLKPVVRP